MEKHQVRFNDKNKITIVPAGDVHRGNPNCAWQKFIRFLQWAEKEKDLYVILMGDLLDTILATDKRYDAGSKHIPLLEAIEQMYRVLKPLADKGKILGMHIGNHEYKMVASGVGNPIDDLCVRLNVKYLGYSALTRILVRRKESKTGSLTIFSHHGWFSGRKRGSKINNLEDLSMNWDADLYLVAHSHDLFSSKRIFTTFHGQKVRAFVSTGAFLKTADWGTCSYSERAGYPPQKLGVARIEWEPFRTTRVENGRQEGDIHITT